MSIKEHLSNALGRGHDKLVFARRTRVLASQIGAVLPPGSVLDVGCGDGTIDTMIQEQRPDLAIRGVDIMIRPSTLIPVDRFDGESIPLADGEVESVMFIDVLHHTNDPMVLLKDAARVARQAVVIKDHCSQNPLDYWTLRFMDWVGNAPHGVVLPYNYWSREQWLAAFDRLGLKLISWEDSIPLYPFPASAVFGRKLHFIAKLSPH